MYIFIYYYYYNYFLRTKSGEINRTHTQSKCQPVRKLDERVERKLVSYLLISRWISRGSGKLLFALDEKFWSYWRPFTLADRVVISLAMVLFSVNEILDIQYWCKIRWDLTLAMSPNGFWHTTSRSFLVLAVILPGAEYQVTFHFFLFWQTPFDFLLGRYVITG